MASRLWIDIQCVPYTITSLAYVVPVEVFHLNKTIDEVAVTLERNLRYLSRYKCVATIISDVGLIVLLECSTSNGDPTQVQLLETEIKMMDRFRTMFRIGPILYSRRMRAHLRLINQYQNLKDAYSSKESRGMAGPVRCLERKHGYGLEFINDDTYRDIVAASSYDREWADFINWVGRLFP